MQTMNASADAGLDSATEGAAAAETGRCVIGRAGVVGMLLVALVVRCWKLEQVGLEHFDEGVYAFSGLWVLGVPFYTGQHYYAPPLLPGLIGIAYWLLGVSDHAAIAVSLAAGTVTVLLVWWVGRRWYGPAAGLAAGWLAALSDVHIAYSRMALTDVLLTLWLVLAIGCLREGLRRGSFRWAVAGGLATALAWNTKYNGWLPLVIALVPLVWAGARSFAAHAPLPRRALGCWLVAVGVALAGYLPWFDYVQHQPGGYARLVGHHSGYLVGWSGWSASFAQQAAHLGHWDATANRLALPLAVIGAACCAPMAWRRDGWVVGLLALIVLAAGLQFSAITVALVLAGLFAAAHAGSGKARGRMAARPGGSPDASAGLHVAWFFVLLLLTPFYTPYARLILPWLPAVWLAAGAATGRVLVPQITASVRSCASQRPYGARALLVGTAVIAVGSLVFRFPESAAPTPAWRRTDRYRTAARKIARRVPERGRVLVYAEPALLFYLLVGNEGTPGRPAQPLESPASLEQAELPTQVANFLVLGPHRDQEAGARASLQRAMSKRLRLLESFTVDEPAQRPLDGSERARGGAARFDLYSLSPLRR